MDSENPPVTPGLPAGSEKNAESQVIIAAVHRMQHTLASKGLMRQQLPRQKFSLQGSPRSAFSASRDDDHDTTRDPQEDSPHGLPSDAHHDLGPLGAYTIRMKIRTQGVQASHRSADKWHSAPGLARFKIDSSEPEALGNVLNDVVTSRQWVPSLSVGTLIAQWPHIVGGSVAEHCTIEAFENGSLIVRCSSTAWAKQLTLLLPHIERRIAEEVGQGLVSQVVIRGPVSPSWKKGYFTIPGRGVRDTYG